MTLDLTYDGQGERNKGEDHKWDGKNVQFICFRLRRKIPPQLFFSSAANNVATLETHVAAILTNMASGGCCRKQISETNSAPMQQHSATAIYLIDNALPQNRR